MDEAPLYPKPDWNIREISARSWRPALVWWIVFITVQQAILQTVAILVAADILHFSDSQFIAYITATTGANTAVGLAGAKLLSVFEQSRGTS